MSLLRCIAARLARRIFLPNFLIAAAHQRREQHDQQRQSPAQRHRQAEHEQRLIGSWMLCPSTVLKPIL
jgi:hypothetical protein